MSSSFKCVKCGVVSPDRDHICQPYKMKATLEYCGSPPEQPSEICEAMDQAANFKCATCDRPSDDPTLLCFPSARS